MTARKPLPHGIAGRPFTVAQARALGVSRARLAEGDLAHPFSGIRTPAAPPVHDPVSAADWRQVFSAHQRRNRELCAAFNLRMPSAGFFCGPTAALLHGVPLPYRLSSDPRLHIGLPEGYRAVQAVGTVGHSYSMDEHGRFIARVDMMFRQHRLILEYEGLQHLLDADQWNRDIRRTRRLEAEGWRVIRVTQADLRDLSSLIGLIAAHLSASC